MLEDDGCLRVAPVTASVTQLKGMLPKPDATVTLAAMDEAIARTAACRSANSCEPPSSRSRIARPSEPRYASSNRAARTSRTT